jgi:hypothetical protein
MYFVATAQYTMPQFYAFLNLRDKKFTMKKMTQGKSIKLTAFFYIIAITGILAVVNACNKSKPAAQTSPIAAAVTQRATGIPFVQGAPQTKIVTVLDISANPGGTSKHILFRGLEEPFNVSDMSVVATLTTAMNENKPIRITFNPWTATVITVAQVSEQERIVHSSREVVSGAGASYTMDIEKAGPDVINQAGIAAINTTTGGLTEVIPDMATAQIMFDYITHQCCQTPGPYGIDFCISFQYCEDGCFARAHKMCWILNNKYNYATHKVFSFAYPGTYTLAVKGEKWGGCCINWWYHVAPLVNIKTPSGTKAYVFDPAMFDVPVTLAAWLHAQANPSCASGRIPRVTSFNIQPTSSYAPNDTSSFITDPFYTDTDTTLVHFSPLKTCP